MKHLMMTRENPYLSNASTKFVSVEEEQSIRAKSQRRNRTKDTLARVSVALATTLFTFTTIRNSTFPLFSLKAGGIRHCTFKQEYLRLIGEGHTSSLSSSTMVCMLLVLLLLPCCVIKSMYMGLPTSVGMPCGGMLYTVHVLLLLTLLLKHNDARLVPYLPLTMSLYKVWFDGVLGIMDHCTLQKNDLLIYAGFAGKALLHATLQVISV